MLQIKNFRYYASDTYTVSCHFILEKIKFILFSKARGLWKTDISFAGHPIKQHETVEYQKFQGPSKKSFKSPKENICQDKIPVWTKQVPNSCI